MSAADAWTRFTGDEPDTLEVLDIAEPEGEVVSVGTLDAIRYRADAGGVPSDLLHEFDPRLAPDLATDDAGTPYIVGGCYSVDPDRGIVDNKRTRRRWEPELPEDDSPLWILGELAELRVTPDDGDPWAVEFPEGDGPRIAVAASGALLLEAFDLNEDDD